MKNIILAAGYATRLYPLTENFPKPLLKIGGSTILGRLIDDVDSIDDVDEHIIVTNHKFADQFKTWSDKVVTKHPISIVDDGSTTNDNRLGAVKDLLLALSSAHIEDDILVAAADNILDFSLQDFVNFFNKKKSSCILCHNEPSIKALQRTGVIAVDDHWKVLEMQEKPEKPVSNWAVPPFYIYARKDLPLINAAMQNGCGYDAPGNLAHYLVDKTDVYAWQMPGHRFDIGSLDSYEKAKENFIL